MPLKKQILQSFQIWYQFISKEDRYFYLKLDANWQNKSFIAPEDSEGSVSVQCAPSSNYN